MALLSGIFDPTLGFFVSWDYLYGLLVISFILTLISTIAYKYLTDQKYMKQEKEEIKRMSKEMRELKDSKEMMKKQKELMERNFGMMKHSFRPLLFTAIPFFIIFSWLSQTYKEIDLNFLGFIHNWIWVYLLSSIIFSIILRKILKVY